MSEKIYMKWNDYHSTVSKSFGILRNEDCLHDVTLVGDDHTKVSAHKLVLSASSNYFKDIFKNNHHAHPLLFIDGISSVDLQNVMDYIYNGEVQIYQDYVDKFLVVARRLKLEGLNDGGNTEGNVDIQYIRPKVEVFQPLDEEQIVAEAEDPLKCEQESPKKKQNINEKQIITEAEDPLKCEQEAPKKKLGNSVGTVAVTQSTEDINPINEQVFKYLEECFDGGYRYTYRCSLCGVRMPKKPHILNHIETHIKGVSYNCQICQKSFRNKNLWSSHKSRFHKVQIIL